MISIVTPYYHEEPYQQYLEAVNKFMPQPCEWIVVDDRGNGYNPAITKYIKNEEHLGYSKSINIGIAASTGERVLLLNNDAILTAGCVEELNRILSLDSKIGIVGARAFSEGAYVEPVEYDIYGKIYGAIKDFGDYQQVKLLNSECVLIRREMINDIGVLDSEHFYHDGSDLEYSMRAIRAGWKLMFAKNTTLYHDHGRYKKDKQDKEKGMQIFKLLIDPNMLINVVEL